MSTDDEDAWSELYAYTLSRGDAEFVHQHVVDARCAQDADATTPFMRLSFALVGLYLHVERGYTGRQVQQVHTMLARRRPTWPALVVPSAAERPGVTARDLLAIPAGAPRDAAISAWCAEVWKVYEPCRRAIIDILNAALPATVTPLEP
jgi:hypothetical protein